MNLFKSASELVGAFCEYVSIDAKGIAAIVQAPAKICDTSNMRSLYLKSLGTTGLFQLLGNCTITVNYFDTHESPCMCVFKYKQHTS